ISHDLPSVVNSTPTLGIGWFAWSGKKRLSIGVRYLHISNANTHRENAGQNQVLLYLSVFNF
ncbi:acyloxyacyl hydrolase, partial [Vibrio parahaemolyticus]